VTHRVSEADPLFTEYCLSRVATIARNHARCLGLAEPDALPNSEFAAWYFGHVFGSEDFRCLMHIKERVRESGYAAAPPDVRNVAIRYLEALAERCAET